MATHPLGSVLRHLRHMVAPSACHEGTDRQLLERFAASNDEAAFEALLHRHGPLVLSTCRRLLGDSADADDAFQATFLVLVRRAAAVPWRDCVGSWLHQVAYRVALKARAVTARRRAREKQEADMPAVDGQPEAARAFDDREERTLLDEELQRLPAKYRAPLVLCYLQGKTHEEAAHELGWPRGSLAKRLLHAQELLRQRLTRRGAALGTGGAFVGLAESAPAALPAALLSATLKAATLFAAGETAIGTAAPGAILAEGVLRTMFLNKLKITAAVVLLCGLLGAGAGVFLTSAEAKDEKLTPRSGLPTTTADATKAKADVAALVKGNNQFAFDLYAKLRTAEGNLFFSPYSISSALAMTYNGADGGTAEEMAKAMHFTLGQERLHPAFGALSQTLNGGGQKRHYQLNVANALWTQKDYGFRPEFIQSTRAHYGAAPFEVDAFNEKAEEAINAWVEQQTQGKIKKLFNERSLSSVDTVRLVLANAIYFKGDWLHKFNKEHTKDGDFHVSAKQKVTVPLMHQTEDFMFAETETFRLLELPYRGKELSMVLLLPKKVDGLPELEKKVSAERLTAWLAEATEQEVQVTLPRFQMTAEFDLKDTLTALGMPSLFTNSDLARMSDKRLTIARAVHKAYVDVNEQGTEAAAATGISAADSVPPRFNADHPFLFLIRDQQSGSMLFLGRLVDPTK